MMLFGRSRTRLEVMAADFLPFEKSLHIVVADADMNLQVLQFDPESKSFCLLYNLLNNEIWITNLTSHSKIQNPWAASVSSINPLSIRATSPWL